MKFLTACTILAKQYYSLMTFMLSFVKFRYGFVVLKFIGQNNRDVRRA